MIIDHKLATEYISYFYGIIIVMYLKNKEHNPPHIHAITQDFEAPFDISTGEIMEGFFPAKAKALVKEFVLKYQKELSDITGIDQSDISKIERGVANPSVGTLERIAEALGGNLLISIEM